MIEDDCYYLIKGSNIKQVQTDITVINRAIKMLDDKGLTDISRTLKSYRDDINIIVVKMAIKCDVVPRFTGK